MAREMTEELRENETKLVKALSDLRKTHTELRTMQSQLIQTEKAASITELAAGAAHEVKNPLAIVLQGVGFLNQHVQNKDENTTAVLKEMEEAVKRADYVIKGLLNVSRSTQLVLLKENLNSVVDESLMLVKMLLDKGHVKTEKQLDSHLPLLMLDKGKIIQVFINLLTNAIHMMPEGGSVTIRTRAQPLTDADIQIYQDQKHHFTVGQTVVIVEVEDTGPGIEESIQTKIFDPFFTTRRNKGGTGLGLSVVRNIVEMHGGMITLNNRVDGKGACAVIVFPASNHN
jgi:signal transduction histidine kinase